VAVRSRKRKKAFTLIEGNKVRFIEVTTGITGEADIEVTSGVQPDGDRAWAQSRVEDAEGWHDRQTANEETRQREWKRGQLDE
jgi:hypothetical protein